MEQNKLTKVIQFVDEGIKRRIDKGYYGSPTDWNPKGEISIYTPAEVSTLEHNGVVFEQNPSITESGYSTFIEIENFKYAGIEKYAPSFMANKQQVLALVLQKLGIHEYFIKSKFQFEAGLGHKTDSQNHVDVEITGSGKVSADTQSKHDVGVDVNAYKVGAEYNKCKGRVPSIQEWAEAKELSIASGVYTDIADIIEMRKPGSNEFQCKLIHKKMGGQIDVNISMASSLKALACFSAAGGIGANISRSLDANVNVKGFYDTLILYNFDPETDSVEYKQLVDKELGTILNDIN